MAAKNVHDFTVKTIRGADKKLADYDGKVMLIVNVASECGLTPQYEGLEKLHEEYAGKGLAVLGFPANEFGAQEPGTNEQIEQFCSVKFGAKFDMFAKVAVKGEQTAPLFDWNFNKFLVGKDGSVIGRFEPKVEPTSPEVKSAIEAALKA
jgi:glutathione peroxidase